MRVEIQYANDAFAAAIDPKRLDGLTSHVKVTDVTWASLEALPGRSPAAYNWLTLDAIIESWRRAGFDVSCIVLRCQHWLATAPTYASRGGPLSSAPGWNQAPKAEMDARLLALERGDVKAREALYVEQVDTTHERILAAEAAGCEAIGVGPIMPWPLVTGQPWQSLLDATGKPLPVCDVIRAAQ